MRDIYQDVTNKIVAELEQGTAPWVRPWSGGIDPQPRNGASGRAYRGINNLMLNLTAAACRLPFVMRQCVGLQSQATKRDLGGFHSDKYLSLSSVQPLQEPPQHVGVVRPGHALPVFCLNALSGPTRLMILLM